MPLRCKVASLESLALCRVGQVVTKVIPRNIGTSGYPGTCEHQCLLISGILGVFTHGLFSSVLCSSRLQRPRVSGPQQVRVSA